MQYKKIWSRELDHCYAITVMPGLNGQPHAFFAAENKNPCFAIPVADMITPAEPDSELRTPNCISVWEQPGGTMSIVPIPGKSGEFLAVQKFYRLFNWEETCLVWVKPDSSGGYQIKELFTLPYLHRFDILTRDGKSWLIACTLAAHKKERDDWTLPGSIYVCPMPNDWDGEFKLETLKGNCFRNHGYVRIVKDGHDVGLVGCEQGVFEIEPPDGNGSTWKITQLMTQPTSDMDVIDIDGDGELEIATIEPFHGSYFRIYRKSSDSGQYIQVFEHSEVTEFYHVVKAGRLAGNPCFVGGCRRGKRQLFVITWDTIAKSFVVNTVDENVGPSNVCIYNGDPAKGEPDILFSANREVGHATAYLVNADDRESLSST